MIFWLLLSHFTKFRCTEIAHWTVGSRRRGCELRSTPSIYEMILMG